MGKTDLIRDLKGLLGFNDMYAEIMFSDHEGDHSFADKVYFQCVGISQGAQGIVVLDEFLLRLEPRVLALRDGHFDVAGWHSRQVTTGRAIRIEMPDGSTQRGTAVGVDGATGALLVADGAGVERELLVGEVTHVRLGSATGEVRGEPAPGFAATARAVRDSAAGVTQ